MKNLIILTKVMAKTSDEALMQGKKVNTKKGSKLAMGLLYIFLAVYMLGIAGVGSYFLIDTLHSIGQAGVSFKFLFLALNALSLFTALIATPTVLYFSKDIESYLVLPVKPWEILGAKFLVSLISVYIVNAVLMLPFIAIYFYLTGFNFITLILYIIVAILAPLFPIAIVSIAVVLIFTFIPFVRNKDLFTYFTMFIAIAISMSMSLFTRIESLDAQGLLNLLSSGDNSLMSVVQSPFNPSSQFAEAILNHDVVALLLGTLIALALCALLGFIGQALYFKGAIGIQETSSKKKNLSSKESHKRSKKQPQVLSLVKQDLRLILRTPIYFTNYYFGVILLPILMIVPIVTEGGFDHLPETLAQIRLIIASIETLWMIKIVILIGFAMGFCLATFSTMAATSFSRDGSTLQQMLCLPVSLKTLYHSKLSGAIFTLSPFPMLYALILGLLLNLNLILVVLMLLAVILGTITSSIISCIFDIIAPKLNWESEQQAVKQNFVSMIAMFGEMGVIGLSIYAFVKLDFDVAFVLVILGITLISIVIYIISTKLLEGHFRNKIELS